MIIIYKITFYQYILNSEEHSYFSKIILIDLHLRKKNIFLKCCLLKSGKVVFYSYFSSMLHHIPSEKTEEIEVYQLIFDDEFKKVLKALNCLYTNMKEIDIKEPYGHTRSSLHDLYTFYNNCNYDCFVGDGTSDQIRGLKMYNKFFKHLTKQYPIIFEEI